jgi:hypothetical protein
MAAVTRLGLYGGARPLYGTFDKSVNPTKTYTSTVTRHALYAGARPLYGSYANKVEAVAGSTVKVIRHFGLVRPRTLGSMGLGGMGEP